MIDNQLVDDNQTGSLTLYQNQSLSWKGNKIFIAILAAYTTFFCIGWYQIGAWLVLPFAGAEVLLVWVLIYTFKLHQRYREQLIFTKDQFIIKSGHKQCDHEKVYPRHAVRFKVFEPKTWHHKRLYIQYLDQQFEIAQYLSDEDKDDLIDLLEKLLIRPAMR